MRADAKFSNDRYLILYTDYVDRSRCILYINEIQIESYLHLREINMVFIN